MVEIIEGYEYTHHKQGKVRIIGQHWSPVFKCILYQCRRLDDGILFFTDKATLTPVDILPEDLFTI